MHADGARSSYQYGMRSAPSAGDAAGIRQGDQSDDKENERSRRIDIGTE